MAGASASRVLFPVWSGSTFRMVRCGWAGCPGGSSSPVELGGGRSWAGVRGPEEVRAARSRCGAQSVRARLGWCSHLSSCGQPARHERGCPRWKTLKPPHPSPRADQGRSVPRIPLWLSLPAPIPSGRHAARLTSDTQARIQVLICFVSLYPTDNYRPPCLTHSVTGRARATCSSGASRVCARRTLQDF